MTGPKLQSGGSRRARKGRVGLQSAVVIMAAGIFLSAGYGRVYLYRILIFHGLVTGHNLALPDRYNPAYFCAGIPGDSIQKSSQAFRAFSTFSISFWAVSMAFLKAIFSEEGRVMVTRR